MPAIGYHASHELVPPSATPDGCGRDLEMGFDHLYLHNVAGRRPSSILPIQRFTHRSHPRDNCRVSHPVRERVHVPSA
jgi:hypothetical protein